MVPPPDNSGETFPDFDKMTFEEQMAWLESLARRQGARDDELTTAADLDIPIPQDAVVDEPGYVPFEGSRSAREMKEAAQAAQQATGEDAFEAAFEESAESALGDSGEAFPEELSAAPAYDGDPMNWLDGLAVQPSADFDLEAAGFGFDQLDEMADLDLVAEDRPGDAGLPEELYSAVPEAAVEDPLGGIDPMLFLESLAARQGANAAEFLTAANLQIEEPPPDAVIDEPGYVPFEGSRSAREAAALAAYSLEPQAIETAPESGLLSEMQWEEPADLGPEILPAGAESLEWLETLARRQGAREEELLTAASLEVPEITEDVVVDEPGYVDYEPLAILPPDRADAAMVSRAGGHAPEAAEVVDDGLGWLEDLAAEPALDFEEFLDLGGGAEADRRPTSERAGGTDPLAGMSDEDIARAQAEGTLTPEQELAWLKRQARALAEVREAQAADQAVPAEQELPPAEPAILPSWVEEMRQTAEEPAAVGADSLAGMGEVFAEEVEPEGEWVVDQGAETQPGVVVMDGDVESLWAEAEEISATGPAFGIPDSELAAFVAGDFVPDTPDLLAEALDEEYERRILGDETEPEWYARAVAQAAAGETEAAEQAEFSGMPEWLAEEGEETAQPAVIAEEDIPAWLRDLEPEAVAAVEGEIPAWLSEETGPVAAVGGDAVPEWLTGTEQALTAWGDDQAERVSAPETGVRAAPVMPRELLGPDIVPRRAEARIPAGVLFDQYRERLEQDPADHPTRLGLARALRAAPETRAASLDQYEILIESAQLLQDVAADLDDMVQQQPDVPRLHRLLGDVYLRRGELQHALEAYRTALDRL